jgi:hypothetical protein
MILCRLRESALLSLPGLTRQSIICVRLLTKKMDARVKPAHDYRSPQASSEAL